MALFFSYQTLLNPLRTFDKVLLTAGFCEFNQFAASDLATCPNRLANDDLRVNRSHSQS